MDPSPKTFSLEHEDFVVQSFAFPVAALNSVMPGEGGLVLNIEGHAKYQFWPLYIGDKPDRTPTITDTVGAQAIVVLTPKHDIENAKITQF